MTENISHVFSTQNSCSYLLIEFVWMVICSSSRYTGARAKESVGSTGTNRGWEYRGTWNELVAIFSNERSL